MYPNPILEIGDNIKVYMYGLMIAVGLVIALALVLPLYAKRLGVSQRNSDFVFYNLLVCIPLGFGVAALSQSLYSYIEALKNGEEAVFEYSGITVISGILGGAAIYIIIHFLFRKKLGLDLLAVLPIISPMITVAHAFGRLGCFFAGCCHGKPTDSALGMTFLNSGNISLKYRTSSGRTVPLLPTQLYEAIFLFILFAVLSYLLLKFKFKYTMSVYLVLYGIFRFIIEFFRGDSRGAFLGILSPSQFWSLFMILLGVGVYFLQRYFVQKAEQK